MLASLQINRAQSEKAQLLMFCLAILPATGGRIQIFHTDALY